MLETSLTNIDHRQLTLDPDFRHRKVAENATHLSALRKTLRNTGHLDAILVWREQDDEGNETGRLVLLDGHFRVTAYRAESAAGHVQGKGIPALIGKQVPASDTNQQRRREAKAHRGKDRPLQGRALKAGIDIQPGAICKRDRER